MSLLFTKGKIGTLELENRLIMTTMHTGLCFPEETEFLVERVKNGADMVTMSLGVHSSAANYDMLIACAENKDAIANVADKVEKEGGKLCVQLFHTGRNAKEESLADKNAVPVAPSAIPSPIYKAMPKELTIDEINEVYSHFEKAAQICKDAKAHALEISCSAGYLLSEFLSDKANLRNDEYGGSRENRFKFPLNVIKRVRAVVGTDYPVLLRISGTDMLGGYSLEDMIAFSVLAQPHVDAINVTGGWHESQVPQISMQVPPGNFAFLAAAIKQAVKIPVIACNRINNIETAEAILKSGFADFVGCARAFLADDKFAAKIKENIPHLYCIGCNKGCIENVLKFKPVTCIFNPTIGYEAKYHNLINKKRDFCEKIIIAGGGPAGLSAAKYLSLAGHDVSIYTKETSFGGSMHYAKKIPSKDVIDKNIAVMVDEAKAAGAKLFTGVEVDIDFIDNKRPDRVIVATGSEAIIPPIEGVLLPNVRTLKEVFDYTEEQLFELISKKICIIGGGASGMEFAYYLLTKSPLLVNSRAFLDVFAAPELKDSFSYPGNITVVEMTKKAGADFGAGRWAFMRQLERYPITIKTEAKVEKITETCVEVLHFGEIKNIDAEVVILATGYKPSGQSLIEALTDKDYKFNVIGDCNSEFTPGIMNATKNAFALLEVI